MEGEKGSTGEKGARGEKGQKGMPGTCDVQVVKEYLPLTNLVNFVLSVV